VTGSELLSLASPVLPGVHLLLGLLLSGWTLLFLFRIVLTWYPQLDLSKGALRLVGWPTEPLLGLTRKLVAPIGGVDVTPVIWVGLISLVRELLVGQQGVVTQVMIRASVLPA
jgi:YggT family protein